MATAVARWAVGRLRKSTTGRPLPQTRDAWAVLPEPLATDTNSLSGSLLMIRDTSAGHVTAGILRLLLTSNQSILCSLCIANDPPSTDTAV